MILWEPHALNQRLGVYFAVMSLVLVNERRTLNQGIKPEAKTRVYVYANQLLYDNLTNAINKIKPFYEKKMLENFFNI